MPIYEYHCKSCAHHFETLQKMSDPILLVCPECHTPNLIKEVSLCDFHLSGSGWYKTDYAKPDPSNQNQKQATDSEKTSSEAATSTQKTTETAVAQKSDSDSDSSKT